MKLTGMFVISVRRRNCGQEWKPTFLPIKVSLRVLREEMSTCLKIEGPHTLSECSLLQWSNKARAALRLVSFRAWCLFWTSIPAVCFNRGTPSRVFVFFTLGVADVVKALFLLIVNFRRRKCLCLLSLPLGVQGCNKSTSLLHRFLYRTLNLVKLRSFMNKKIRCKLRRNICTFLLNLAPQTSGSLRSIFTNLYMFTSLWKQIQLFCHNLLSAT